MSPYVTLVARKCWNHARGLPRLCLHALLCTAKSFLVHLAMKCSSFTPVNRGTSCRTPCTSLGCELFQSVIESNCLGSRNLGFMPTIFIIKWIWVVIAIYAQCAGACQSLANPIAKDLLLSARDYSSWWDLGLGATARKCVGFFSTFSCLAGSSS